MSTNQVTPAASPAAAVKKASWLSHVGDFLGKVLKVIAGKAAPTADIASKVAAIMFPQFATEIAAADNLVDNIAKEALAAEAMEAAGAAAQGGPAKLNAVLANTGAAIDQWVASRFPGSATVSSASKAGLVNAVVKIVNELQPPAGIPATPGN
jgi:hypothetical protein